MEVESTPVIIGQRYKNGITSIESGIHTTDTVIAEGLLDLYPGKKVTVQKWVSNPPKGAL
jgi:hypothetical protein